MQFLAVSVAITFIVMSIGIVCIVIELTACLANLINKAIESAEVYAPYGDKEHHPWCNFWNINPESCPQCMKLKEKFPTKDQETLEELTTRFFPNVTIKELKAPE